MPFAYNRLPDALRAKVSYVSLMGFAPDGRFPDSRDRLARHAGKRQGAAGAGRNCAKLPPAMVQCIYGEKEEDTLCPTLTKTGIDVIRLPGDHHFGGDYDALAKRILGGWQKQIAARSGA